VPEGYYRLAEALRGLVSAVTAESRRLEVIAPVSAVDERGSGHASSNILAGLGVLLAILTGPVALAEENALKSMAETGIVRIAVPDNFPPFGNLGADGKLHGYDIDTAALIAEGLNAKVDLVATASADRIPALTAGKVDLVVSSLGKNAEREKLIDFSIAYAPFYSAVYGPLSLPVAKPDDLAGRTIAVTRGTIEDTVLTGLAPATTTIKRFDDNAATQVAFLSNQAELIVTGNVVASEVLSKSLVKKTVLKFLLRNSPCYVGLAKDQPKLLALVNMILRDARKDGRLDRIADHWLTMPLGDPEHPDLTALK
jgi:polar amino acid transport system substrate-binding protein